LVIVIRHNIFYEKKKGKGELLFMIYNVLYVIAYNDHIKTELYFIALSKKYIKKRRRDIGQMCHETK
jgi:hypothetical protein